MKNILILLCSFAMLLSANAATASSSDCSETDYQMTLPDSVAKPAGSQYKFWISSISTNNTSANSTTYCATTIQKKFNIYGCTTNSTTSYCESVSSPCYSVVISANNPINPDLPSCNLSSKLSTEGACAGITLSSCLVDPTNATITLD